MGSIMSVDHVDLNQWARMRMVHKLDPWSMQNWSETLWSSSCWTRSAQQPQWKTLVEYKFLPHEWLDRWLLDFDWSYYSCWNARIIPTIHVEDIVTNTNWSWLILIDLDCGKKFLDIMYIFCDIMYIYLSLYIWTSCIINRVVIIY